MTRVSAGEVLSRSFDLVLRNFATYFRTYGVLLLVAGALGLVVDLLGVRMTTAFVGLDTDADPQAWFRVFGEVAPALSWSFLLGIVSFFVGLIGFGIGIVATDALLRDERIDLREAWRRLSPRTVNFALTALLVTLIFVGLIILGVIGLIILIGPLIAIGVIIYLAARWSVALPASIFEDRADVGGNLQSASDLTAGSRGSLAGLFIILVVISAVVSLVLTLPFSVGTLDFTGEVMPVTEETVQSTVLSRVVITAGNLVLSPVFAAAVTVAYWKLSAARDAAAAGPEPVTESGSDPASPPS